MNETKKKKKQEIKNHKRYSEEHLQREKEAIEELSNLSDQQILDIVREKTKELGRVPKKAEIPGASYIKQRFGPWHRVLETAGVRAVTPERMARQAAKKNKHKRRKDKKCKTI